MKDTKNKYYHNPLRHIFLCVLYLGLVFEISFHFHPVFINNNDGYKLNPSTNETSVHNPDNCPIVLQGQNSPLDGINVYKHNIHEPSTIFFYNDEIIPQHKERYFIILRGPPFKLV